MFLSLFLAHLDNLIAPPLKTVLLYREAQC